MKTNIINFVITIILALLLSLYLPWWSVMVAGFVSALFFSLKKAAVFFVPFLAVFWGAWVLTLQYVDYPADNNHMSFSELRQQIKNKRYSTLGFGGVILIGSMIPIINIFIMPIAVAGGTLFWINELSSYEITS